MAREHPAGGRWPLLDQRIFVSSRSLEQQLRPRFVYREEPDDMADSGWRAMVGDESAAEADDPGSVRLETVGAVLHRWPELRAVFETDPAHGSWVWDPGTESYRPLDDA